MTFVKTAGTTGYPRYFLYPLVMKPIIRKAFAYVTHGNRLLMFSHPLAPEAGLQAPAGTMLDGEAPEDAVLREAIEETALADLRVVRFLGEVRRDRADVGRAEIHHRFFFHVVCDSQSPERWQNYEVDDMYDLVCIEAILQFRQRENVR